MLSEKVKNLQGQPMFDFQSKVKKLEKQGKNFIHFEIGDPDFCTDISIINTANLSLTEGHTHYTPSKGIPDLINAICNKHDVKPEKVLITPGANISVFYVLSCLCNEDDIVAIPNPGFSTYSLVAKFLKLNIFDYCNNNFNYDFNIPKVTIINSPNNPTGELCNINWNKFNSYLYYDNIYFSYDCHTERIKKYKKNEINVYSFSKMYSMTGFRLGYIIADPELINKMEILLNLTNSCIPEFIQRAGIVALQTDNTQMIEEYRKRRDVIVEELNKINGISCPLPDGAFYVFPDITKTGLTSKEFADKALESGVALLDGNCFGSEGEGYVRLSYASTDIEQILEGINRLKKIL